MCLLAFGIELSPRYRFAFAANRDELHTRPTASANWWTNPAGILGGRDLVAGGSWLAVDEKGRLAAVTNCHDPSVGERPRSRGLLVSDYLSGSRSSEDFLAGLQRERDLYGPFNLLVFDGHAARYFSNRAPGRLLRQGAHALSNAPLGVPWPKVRRAKQGIRAALRRSDTVAALFELLAERAAAGETQEQARKSGLFVEDERFGTRSSTVVLLSNTGEVSFVERRFDAAARLLGESRHGFTLGA
jgi:uncharacterized protein with NRDE domain